MPDIGYYTVPVILSMEGVTKQAEKGLGNTFGVIGKKSGQDMAKGVASGLAAGQSQITAATAKVTGLLDRQKDALGRVRVAQEKLNEARSKGASGSQLATAEERFQAALRKSQSASHTYSAALTELDSLKKRVASGPGLGNEVVAAGRLSQAFGGAATALGGFGNKLKQISAAVPGLALPVTGIMTASTRLGELGVAAEGAGTGLAAVGTVAGGAAVIGLGALAVGTGVVLKQFYDLGAVLDDVADTLQIKTGASGTALEGLKQSVMDIGRITPSSIGTIGDVVAEVGRNLHLTGGDLESVARTITNLNRLTGEPTNVRALGKAFRAFGVDAKDQTAALDSLNGVSQKTGLTVNDLTESVTKGAAPLKAFGFSFGEAAGLITSFEEAGLDGQKAMTALNKAFAYFADKGVPARQGLRDTVTEIQRLISIGQTPQAADLATTVFGGRAGANFFDLIQDGQLDLQQLSATLDGTGRSINDLSDDTADAAEAWQLFKNRLEEAAAPIATKVFDITSSGLKGLGDWVDEHQPAIIGFFTALGTQTISGVRGMVSGLEGGIKALALFVNAIGDTLGGIVRSYAAVQRLFGRTDEANRADAQADAMFGWADGLNSVVDGLHELGPKLEAAQGAMQTAGDAANTAAQFTRDLGDNIELLPDGKTIVLKDNSAEAISHIDATKYSIEQIPGTKEFRIVPKTQEAQDAMDAWYRQQTQRPPIEPVIAPKIDPVKKAELDQYFSNLMAISGVTPPPAMALPPPQVQPLPLPQPPGFDFPPGASAPGHAAGGRVRGRGGPRSDNIPAWLSSGEHVFTAKDVQAMGGQSDVYAFRQALHFAAGGAATAGPTSAFNRDYVAQIAARFGLQLTSGDRSEPGSYHNVHGGAGDFSNGDKTAQELAFANYLADNFAPYIDELIFDHPQFNRTIKDGAIKGPFGKFYTMGQAGYHGDHVHVAFGKKAASFRGLGVRGNAPGGGLAPLTPDSSPEQVAAAMIQEGRRRGYSDAEIQSVIADALGESGLRHVTNATGHVGFFQQDASYPGRNDPNTNITGFFDQLDKTRGKGDIYSRITSVERGGYGPEFIKQQEGAAADVFGRAAPMVASAGASPGGIPSSPGVTGGGGDPSAMRDAQRRVTEADSRVMEAQGSLAEAEAQQRELEADAKESQKIAAQNRVDKAKADLAKAQQDAQDARSDVSAAQQTPGKDTTGDKDTGKGSDAVSPLKDLVSILGGGILETFGLDGSWLPDLSNLMPLQAANTLLNAFVPPLVKKYGGGAEVSGTSNLPFGIPDITAPPMPSGAEHVGSGAAPGPGMVQNNDMSVTYQGDVGLSPEAIRKQNEKAQYRALTRIPVGS